MIPTPTSEGHESSVATPKKLDLSTELRARITNSLHSRSAPRGTLAAKLEGKLKSEGVKVWNLMRRRPVAGSLVVGGIGLALATAIGVGELTVAMVVGYATYQVLREGVPPKDAAERAFKELEHIG